MRYKKSGQCHGVDKARPNNSRSQNYQTVTENLYRALMPARSAKPFEVDFFPDLVGAVKHVKNDLNRIKSSQITLQGGLRVYVGCIV